MRSIQGIHQLFGPSVAYSSMQMSLATSGDNGARSSNLLSWEKVGNVIHSGFKCLLVPPIIRVLDNTDAWKGDIEGLMQKLALTVPIYISL